MVVSTTAYAVAALAALVRRADRHLAHGAALNAAAGLAARQARHLEDARTLRDLRRLTPDAPDGDGAVSSAWARRPQG